MVTRLESAEQNFHMRRDGQGMLNRTTQDWSIIDATEHYEIERWGQGYFSIGENGHVLVHPTKTSETVDLCDVVRRIRDQGLELPALIRFNDILGQRIADIDAAFRTAIGDNDYHGDYFCVYPIKVNQQRHVVEQILKKGRRLAAASKRVANPSCWPSSRWLITALRSSVTVLKTRRLSPPRCSLKKSAQYSAGDRKVFGTRSRSQAR